METFLNYVTKNYNVLVQNKFGTGVVSTGALSVDSCIGVGGFPKGRVSVVYGAESSGKTTLMLEACKGEILLGNNVLYLDIEQALEQSDLDRVFGTELDITNFILLKPQTAEDALSIIETGIQGNKKAGIDPGMFSLIVVDSLGALATAAEVKKDLTDSTVAELSRILTIFFHRNAFKLRELNTALIFIGQVRDKIGFGFGGYAISGGHALLHYASVILSMSKMSTIKDGEEPVGIFSSVTVKKNKVARPYRKWDKLPIMFDSGIDYLRDVLEFANSLGILFKNGAFYYYGETRLGKGYKEASEFLTTNKDILKEIEDKCKEF